MVFEIGKNFRNEGIDTNHNSEFTSCEFYWAYAKFYDLMDFTEELISSLVLDINRSYIVKVHDELSREIEINFTRPWRRISIMEQLAKILQVDLPEDLKTEEARDFFDDLCRKIMLSVGVQGPQRD